MLELSPEIPFLFESFVRIGVWDRGSNPQLLGIKSKEILAQAQFRGKSENEELRLTQPSLGITEPYQYLETPFFPLQNPSDWTGFCNSWEEHLSSKSVLFLTTDEKEKMLRFHLAQIYLFKFAEKRIEEAAQKFFILGDEYIALMNWGSKERGKKSLVSGLIPNDIPFQVHTYTPSIEEKELQLAHVVVKGKQKETLEIPPAPAIKVSQFQANEAKEQASSPQNGQVTTIEKEVSSEKEDLPSTELQEPQVPQSMDSKERDSQPIPEVEKKQESIDLEKLLKEEPPKTKLSIQLKMMGVISLLFISSVSIIIFFASYYFRYTADLQLRESNLKVAEVVGLKVKSDITAVVEKGRQIAITLTSQGLPEDQRKLLLSTFFKYDKEFVFLGIFEKQGEVLVSKKKVYNEEELKATSLSEEDFENVVKRNEKYFLEAFLGQPVVINTSQGFQEPSFAVAIPATENGQMDNILVMIVKLEKIIGAFEKKGILTTFMVNSEGIILVHPKEELVLSASNLSELPIVKSMITSPDTTRQLTYVDNDTKESFLGTFRKIGFADIGVITTVPEAKAFEAVYLIQERSLYIMGIGLCIALICVFFFSKTITRPILQLLTATLEIAKGNFRVTIKPTTKDEVGLLTRYFIGMGQGLEEREKVKNILGNMIDPVVVQEAMVDLAALKRGSETQITAFFSDVAGFSGISELLTSAELAALLNEYLSAMTLILKQHEGVLDKYIGDAIVGIFNAPVPVADHQKKAARASVDMIRKLNELRKYWTENNLYSKEAQTMDCRIGLNSGLAKVGFMGTDALASYTMMGDTVNLAARLEAAGKDYGVNILITDAVKLTIEDEMHTRYLDLVRVKGKNEPVRIHELISYKSDTPENILSATSIYEQAFQAYLEQNWNRAILLFTESEKIKGKKDKACHVLIERCEDYKKNSPGRDWDGVFTRTHK